MRRVTFEVIQKKSLSDLQNFCVRKIILSYLSHYWSKFNVPNLFQSANTGGLLGLFMGFSVVSIIEILYFISLRPYCVSRRERNKSHQNVTIVEPSRKVWFVEDVDYGKLAQSKQVKNAWDIIDSRKVGDLGNTSNNKGSKSKADAQYPYRE